MKIQVVDKRLQRKKPKLFNIISTKIQTILSSKGIFLTFIWSPTTTDDVYTNLLETKFFLGLDEIVIKSFYFMRDGALHRTYDVFGTLKEVYNTCVIRLG